MIPRQEIGESLIIRKPDTNDGIAIHELVSRSPPLDLNSLYSYLLFSKHFKGTSAVAEHKEEIVGYTSAYNHPQKEDTLFVWQVAVKEGFRGSGIAREMISNILNRRELDKIKYLETTVSPDNQASESLFTGLATKTGAGITKTLFFSRNLFGKSDHPPEYLLRIGPLNKRPLKKSRTV
jgi:L-2,4-diaminobutyric acid acetyltransferase